MGTRGIHGFLLNGKLKISYNQFDMYPGGTGATLCDELRELSLDDVRAAAKRIRLIKGTRPPSEANRKRYAEIADMNVSGQSDADWYCLLRNCHGTIKPWVEGISELSYYDYDKREQVTREISDPKPVGHMLDAADFPADSLFCEWGYVINLDDGLFEVYEGFQKTLHDSGRFASPTKADDSDYYPIKLVATFALDNLPDDMGRLQWLLNGPDNCEEDDPKPPSIEGMSPAMVGKLTLGVEPSHQDKSVDRITKCAPFYDVPEEADTVVKDMLADLRHVCAAKGLDFGALAVAAEDYYADEVKEDQGSAQ